MTRASLNCTKSLGRRVRHFGGRHRTSRSRVRCLEGAAPFWTSQRGTRHPDIDSGPLEAVFIRIRSQSCTDRSSSRGPLVAHPAALSPPPCATKSRPRALRAVLADPNALWWRPSVTGAARRSRRGLAPLVRITTPTPRDRWGGGHFQRTTRADRWGHFQRTTHDYTC